MSNTFHITPEHNGCLGLEKQLLAPNGHMSEAFAKNGLRDAFWVSQRDKLAFGLNKPHLDTKKQSLTRCQLSLTFNEETHIAYSQTKAKAF